MKTYTKPCARPPGLAEYMYPETCGKPDDGVSGCCASCTREAAEQFWAEAMGMPGFLDTVGVPQVVPEPESPRQLRRKRRH